MRDVYVLRNKQMTWKSGRFYDNTHEVLTVLKFYFCNRKQAQVEGNKNYMYTCCNIKIIKMSLRVHLGVYCKRNKYETALLVAFPTGYLTITFLKGKISFQFSTFKIYI